MTVPPPLMWAGQGAGQTLSPNLSIFYKTPLTSAGKNLPKKSTRGKSNRHAYSISHKDSIDTKKKFRTFYK